MGGNRGVLIRNKGEDENGKMRKKRKKTDVAKGG